MAGLTRNNDEARDVKLCAAEHGVSVRTVTKWRAEGAEMWTTWKKARQGGRPASPPKQDVPLEPVADDGLGEGIEAEIFRARAECKRLSHLAATLEQGGDFSDAALVHRILDSKRDGLRKLSADNPDILERAGDLLPKAVLFAYVTRVKLTLQSLPRRLMAAVPEDMRASLQPSLEKEIALVMSAAQEIDLNK